MSWKITRSKSLHLLNRIGKYDNFVRKKENFRKDFAIACHFFIARCSYREMNSCFESPRTYRCWISGYSCSSRSIFASLTSPSTSPSFWFRRFPMTLATPLIGFETLSVLELIAYPSYIEVSLETSALKPYDGRTAFYKLSLSARRRNWPHSHWRWRVHGDRSKRSLRLCSGRLSWDSNILLVTQYHEIIDLDVRNAAHRSQTFKVSYFLILLCWCWWSLTSGLNASCRKLSGPKLQLLFSCFSFWWIKLPFKMPPRPPIPSWKSKAWCSDHHNSKPSQKSPLPRNPVPASQFCNWQTTRAWNEQWYDHQTWGSERGCRRKSKWSVVGLSSAWKWALEISRALCRRKIPDPFKDFNDELPTRPMSTSVVIEIFVLPLH